MSWEAQARADAAASHAEDLEADELEAAELEREAADDAKAARAPWPPPPPLTRPPVIGQWVIGACVNAGAGDRHDLHVVRPQPRGRPQQLYVRSNDRNAAGKKVMSVWTPGAPLAPAARLRALRA